MKQPTKGEQIEAKRLGCEPHELGGANLADAHSIDAAIAEAVAAEREACNDDARKYRRLVASRVALEMAKAAMVDAFVRSSDCTPDESAACEAAYKEQSAADGMLDDDVVAAQSAAIRARGNT